jgi:DNA polymerase-1
MTVFTTHGMLAQDNRTLRTYNLWDCVATARAARAMVQEMRDTGQWGHWEKAVWPLVAPVLDMQERGMRLDTRAQGTFRRKVQRELAEIDEVLCKADPTGAIAKPCGKSPHGLNSNERLAVFLFDVLSLKSQKATATGKRSVDQDSLLRVLKSLRKKDEHARPILYDVFHRSRLKTILERYLDLVPDADGQVRATIKMGGAESGRFAYARPALQQLPPECRHMFIPRDEHVFISADYSQVEARIAAYLAEDDGDIRVFETPGLDIHAETAKELFGWSQAHWEALTVEQRKGARNYAKTFRYRLMYGGAPDGEGMKTYCPCPRCEGHQPPTLDLPLLKITKAGEGWLSRHSRVLTWRAALEKEVQFSRCLTNKLGRKRFFFAPVRVCKREVYNWPIQSMAAELINRAMVLGHEEYGLPFVMQLHDSLMVEVPLSEVAARSAQLREVMEQPVPELGGVVFPVDLDVEVAWGRPT